MPRNQIELDEESLQLYFDLCESEELSHLSSKAKRAEILHFKYGFRKCHLIRLGECTKRIFERMVASHQQGQVVGIRGRRSYITEEDKQRLKGPRKQSTFRQSFNRQRNQQLCFIIFSLS